MSKINRRQFMRLGLGVAAVAALAPRELLAAPDSEWAIGFSHHSGFALGQDWGAVQPIRTAVLYIGDRMYPMKIGEPRSDIIRGVTITLCGGIGVVSDQPPMIRVPETEAKDGCDQQSLEHCDCGCVAGSGVARRVLLRLRGVARRPRRAVALTSSP